MPAVLSFVELDAQHVELLPARTVLSMFSTGDGGTATNGTDSTGGGQINLLNRPITLWPGTPGVNGVDANG
ncbi:MAG: hypothetical protein QOH09_929 [Pseudonocardiales bacterium]|jgi:hypothetical protein|nr:hypothetical protein [Pseudonocardiales bacterium]MDT7714937.1 hypothetical protein [Pseudonocardiales bacterium]